MTFDSRPRDGFAYVAVIQPQTHKTMSDYLMVVRFASAHSQSLRALTLAGRILRSRFSRLITGRAPKEQRIWSALFLERSRLASERHDLPPCTYRVVRARMGWQHKTKITLRDGNKRRQLLLRRFHLFNFSPQCFFCMPRRHDTFSSAFTETWAANVRDHRAAVGVSLLYILIFLCIIHRHFSRRIFPTHGNK